MTSILQKGKDKLLNGVILGAVFGAVIVWGATIYDWLLANIPSTWLVLGELSVPVYVVGAGAVLGWAIDRW